MEKIIQTLRNFGLEDNFVANGKVNRCHSNAKQKRNKGGWYVIYKNENNFYCVYGCWYRGESKKISSNNDINFQFNQNIFDPSTDDNNLKINDFLKRCTKPNFNHKYINHKQLQLFNLENVLQYHDSLIIPIYNFDNQIVSYQKILPDGKKIFMKGGTVKNCFFMINGNMNENIFVCEGWATAVTINSTTNSKVFCTFTASNLINVVKNLLNIYDKNQIIVCCDNDHDNEENIGIKQGKLIHEQFNIKYIYPENIKGSDFNDLFIEKGQYELDQYFIFEPTIKIIRQEDIAIFNFSLNINENIINNKLIEDGIKSFGENILQYSLCAIFTLIANCIAGKVNHYTIYPNVYNIKVGSTSTGKSNTDKIIKDELVSISKFFSTTEIASGPALLKCLSMNPRGMGIFDEITNIFLNTSKFDPLREGKINTLLEIYSASGNIINKVYSRTENNVNIKFPCFSLMGNATPLIFKEISENDFENGLIQRFNFWYYDGNVHKRPVDQYDNNKNLDNFFDTIYEMFNIKHIKQKHTLRNASISSPSYQIKFTPEGKKILQNYSDDIIDRANLEKIESKKGMILRKYETAVKYALIYNAMDLNIYKPLSKQVIQNGIKVANMLIDWKIDILEKLSISGEFHKNCKIFKDAIISSIKSGRSDPTIGYMCTRKIQIKNWNKKYLYSIIEMLEKRGEILVRVIKGIERFYLIK